MGENDVVGVEFECSSPRLLLLSALRSAAARPSCRSWAAVLFEDRVHLQFNCAPCVVSFAVGSCALVVSLFCHHKQNFCLHINGIPHLPWF